MNLLMLLLFGSCERTMDEFCALLDATGFEFASCCRPSRPAAPAIEALPIGTLRGPA